MSQLSQRCLRAAISRRSYGPHIQTRWIGLKYKKKEENAEKEWQAQAQRIKDGEVESLWDVLERRGFVKDIAGESREQIRELMRVKRIGAYVGIDPTAPSLHIGHVLPLMPLFMMYMRGHRAISLIGSTTARIGDPIGRLQGREPLSSADASKNHAKIHYQLKKMWVHVEERARFYGIERDWSWRRGLLTNASWWNKEPLVEVLKRLGAFMRMGPMLGRESVKRRMNEGDKGMSFAEFTYPLMQAWDWWKLYAQLGVQMQIGGSDQLGNILTGREAVQTIRGSEPNPAEKLPSGPLHEPVGFTVPLLTDSSGAKFGKSAGNAIWLDEFMTTPFDLYGYFVRRPDDEIERLLKLFTFMPCADIAKLMAENDVDRSKRLAHHRLAYEVTCLVHGMVIAKRTQQEHQETYSGKSVPLDSLLGDIRAKAASDRMQFTQDPKKHTTLTNTPRHEIQLPRSLVFSDQPTAVPRLVYAAGLADSVSAAQRLIVAGGLHIAGAPGQPANRNKGILPEMLSYTPMKTWYPEDTKNFVIADEYLIMRKGKHNVAIVQLVDDEEFEAKGLTYRGEKGTGKLRGAIAMRRMLLEEKKALEDQQAANGVDEDVEEDIEDDFEVDDPEEETKKNDKLDKW